MCSLIQSLYVPVFALFVSAGGGKIVHSKFEFSSIFSIKRISLYGSLYIFCATNLIKTLVKRPILSLVDSPIAEMHISRLVPDFPIVEMMFSIPLEYIIVGLVFPARPQA
jgi:hypothetical protein